MYVISETLHLGNLFNYILTSAAIIILDCRANPDIADPVELLKAGQRATNHLEMLRAVSKSHVWGSGKAHFEQHCFFIDVVSVVIATKNMTAYNYRFLLYCIISIHVDNQYPAKQMLAQRLRRWPNIKTSSFQRVVFAG